MPVYCLVSKAVLWITRHKAQNIGFLFEITWFNVLKKTRLTFRVSVCFMQFCTVTFML